MRPILSDGGSPGQVHAFRQEGPVRAGCVVLVSIFCSPDDRMSFGALVTEIYDVPCCKRRGSSSVYSNRCGKSLKLPESWLV